MPREIGLISDTHGLIRPEVFTALAGVELVLHAGDVGGGSVLDELARIAPVQAVAGNTDIASDPRLQTRLTVSVGDLRIHVSHGHELGAPTPLGLVAKYDADVIVYGHTHRALVERIGRQLVVNPGAAGPGRFRLVPSVARLTIADGAAEVKVVALIPR